MRGVLQSSKKTRGRKTNNNLKRAAKRAKDVPLQLMRFSPVLSELLEVLSSKLGNSTVFLCVLFTELQEMLLGKLDVRAYPYLKEPPESARPTGANISNRSARNRMYVPMGCSEPVLTSSSVSNAQGQERWKVHFLHRCVIPD